MISLGLSTSSPVLSLIMSDVLFNPYIEVLFFFFVIVVFIWTPVVCSPHRFSHKQPWGLCTVLFLRAEVVMNPCRKSYHVSFSLKMWIHLSSLSLTSKDPLLCQTYQISSSGYKCSSFRTSSFLHDLVTYLCIWLLCPSKSSFSLFGSFLILDRAPICQHPDSPKELRAMQLSVPGRLAGPAWWSCLEW